MSILSRGCEIQRGDQPFRIDGIGQRLEKVERPEPASKQLQPLAIRGKYAQDRRPFPTDLAEQLQARSVLQALGGNYDLERIRPEQVEAVALVRDGVDRVMLAKRSDDRFVAGGILVDDEHTHAQKLQSGGCAGAASGHGFHILAGFTALLK